MARSKVVVLGTVISPARKNPKKHVVSVAHNNSSSGPGVADRQCGQIWGGVIGRRGGEAELARSYRIPVWISRSLGREEPSQGSGCPI